MLWSLISKEALSKSILTNFLWTDLYEISCVSLVMVSFDWYECQDPTHPFIVIQFWPWSLFLINRQVLIFDMPLVRRTQKNRIFKALSSKLILLRKSEKSFILWNTAWFKFYNLSIGENRHEYNLISYAWGVKIEKR